MKNLIKTLASIGVITPLVFVVLGLAANPSHAEDEEKRIEVVVNQENDQDANVDIQINGKAESFTLPQLTEGETRTIVTESGKTITVTKIDGNTSINLDGEDVEIMNVRGNIGANFEWISDGHDFDFNNENKVFVVGGNLSEEVQAALQATLNSYGIEKELIFPGKDSAHSNVMIFETDDIDTVKNKDELRKNVHKEIKILKKRIKNKTPK